MSTIVFKCGYCDRTMFGDDYINHIRPHAVRVTKYGEPIIDENSPMTPDQKIRFVDDYYICDDCLEYDRKKYMEVRKNGTKIL